MKEQIKQALEKALAGPWRFGNTEEGKRIILGGNDKYVCNVQIYQTPRGYGVYDEPTREANAHLIANAPEWLRWQNERIEQLEKALERCAVGGNSLASILIGFDLPDGWTDWEIEGASTRIYNHYPDAPIQAYEVYETWLCWKTIREAAEALGKEN